MASIDFICFKCMHICQISGWNLLLLHLHVQKLQSILGTMHSLFDSTCLIKYTRKLFFIILEIIFEEQNLIFTDLYLVTQATNLCSNWTMKTLDFHLWACITIFSTSKILESLWFEFFLKNLFWHKSYNFTITIICLNELGFCLVIYVECLVWCIS